MKDFLGNNSDRVPDCPQGGSQGDVVRGDKPSLPPCFTVFQGDVSHFSLPANFTFPFYYDPHPLSLVAASDLQTRLSSMQIDHNFGFGGDDCGPVIGKMFGVLVVKHTSGTLGYLAAFSGKLAGQNHHPGFVPPVYDMLEDHGYFRQEEEVLNTLNARIEGLEQGDALREALAVHEQNTRDAAAQAAEGRLLIKEGKAKRKAMREEARQKMTDRELNAFEALMVKQSLDDQYRYKRMVKQWRETTESSGEKLKSIRDEINALKEARKERSGALQQWLFQQYRFLNARGEEQDLLDVFHTGSESIPPAGAGECAAPKLLQYAYANDLKPIAMAEFWWGAPPKSEVRVHGNFYPACHGKCGPILKHMLTGLKLDENPMLSNGSEDKALKVVYEDEHLLVVNKPAELLSVPGKNITDSVYSRMKLRYPEATGPLIVHRLDMSTSGLLLVAKSKDVHKHLQHQFLRRTVEKRYVALLTGELTEFSGEIDLPLRVDLDDRPRQLVCHVYGRRALTRWERIGHEAGKTRVYFYPLTGRTHQLRVHAAHPAGLNSPICGDDLYGIKSERLCLHAEQLNFMHPVRKVRMNVSVPAEF